MSLLTPPTPFFRTPSYEIDDEITFTNPKTLTFNHTSGLLNIGGSQTIHTSQYDQVATAIEKLFFQDFSALNSENSGTDIDAVVIEGVTVQAGFVINLFQVADLPDKFGIGTQTGATAYSVGMGWSLAKLFRSLGYGTAYVPA